MTLLYKYYVLIKIFTLLAQCLLSTRLVLHSLLYILYNMHHTYIELINSYRTYSLTFKLLLLLQLLPLLLFWFLISVTINIIVAITNTFITIVIIIIIITIFVIILLLLLLFFVLFCFFSFFLFFFYWHVSGIIVHVYSHWIMMAAKHLLNCWGGEGLVHHNC